MPGAISRLKRHGCSQNELKCLTIHPKVETKETLDDLPSKGIPHPELHERVKPRSSNAADKRDERDTRQVYFGVLRGFVGGLTYCMMPGPQAPRGRGDSCVEDT